VPHRPRARQSRAPARALGAAGFTLIELLFAAAVAGTVTAIAVPQFLSGLDDVRAHNAARHLAQQLALARMDAIKRSRFVGLRFEPGSPDYAITLFADGNGNGIRSADITSGVDPPLGPADVLGWHFQGVVFGVLPGVPDADGQPVTTTDGVRVGVSRILSMNPNGSSSSGTLYVHGGQRSQYAVRVLGATGRVRVLKYEQSRRRWVDQ